MLVQSFDLKVGSVIVSAQKFKDSEHYTLELLKNTGKYTLSIEYRNENRYNTISFHGDASIMNIDTNLLIGSTVKSCCLSELGDINISFLTKEGNLHLVMTKPELN